MPKNWILSLILGLTCTSLVRVDSNRETKTFSIKIINKVIRKDDLSLFSFSFSKIVVGEPIIATTTTRNWAAATVTCINGTRITAGGGNCASTGKKGAFLMSNYPISDVEWLVKCVSANGEEQEEVRAEAYVNCI